MKLLKKFPGGLIIIPMLAAILINMFIPGILNLGGPTTGLFKAGNQAMMGLFLIVCGSQINFKTVGRPLYKGVVLLALKFIIGAAIGWTVGAIWGAKGVIGLTPLAVMASMLSANSSLYIALCAEYGNSSDSGAIAIFCIHDGPFLTMIAMGVSGMANIPWTSIVAMIIPLFVGAIWGNLDADFKSLCQKSQNFVIIWMSFGIGSNSSLGTIVKAGLPGVALGLIAPLVGFIYFFVYNLFLKKKTSLGFALGSVAANSALTPGLVAAADPALKGVAGMVAAQCATASIITMLIIPFLVGGGDKWLKKHYSADRLNEQPAMAAAAAKANAKQVNPSTNQAERGTV